MTDCPFCDRAAREECHDFSPTCKGCAARSVSRGPNFYKAHRTGRQDWKYRAELSDRGVTHEQVKEAARTDALQKVKT